MKSVAIVNPMSGWRRAGRLWPELLEEMGPAASNVVTWWTEYSGHAEHLAARARREGFERVIAVGGDGTLFEVANGLWWERVGELPSIGMVPFGTGCDYPRNFDIGRNRREKVASALGESTVRVDAGVCRVIGMDGKPVNRVFLMVLGAGFDALVIRRFRGQKFLRRGRASYAVSVIREILGLRSCLFTGEIDGEPFEATGVMFVAALSRYFGGGMLGAPGASPQAGRFQIVRAEPVSRVEVLPLLYRIYSGRHVSHPGVHVRYARRVRLESYPPSYVQAEGELLGQTPIDLEHIPGAFRFAAAGLRQSAFTPP